MELSSPRRLSVGPRVVPFGGVVEDHIENDFQACPVQRLDHVPKLIHRAERVPPRAVRLVRREERNRRIAPIVDLARRTILGIELENRQQLDRRNARVVSNRESSRSGRHTFRAVLFRPELGCRVKPRTCIS